MHSGRSVLLCDDQASCREALRELLYPTGLQVVGEASNTDDALDRFERLMPDLVIMDVSLLGTWDSMVAIRRMVRYHSLTTVLVTGMASQTEQLMEALTMGAADFFFKPFHARSFKDCLERNLT